MNSADFRKELVKALPGFDWTVHRTSNHLRLAATGTQSSGFNRLATIEVTRTEKNDRVWYEAKSRGYGKGGPWAHTNGDLTLARALRGLQQHYERKANSFRGLASTLQNARQSPSAEATNI